MEQTPETPLTPAQRLAFKAQHDEAKAKWMDRWPGTSVDPEKMHAYDRDVLPLWKNPP